MKRIFDSADEFIRRSEPYKLCGQAFSPFPVRIPKYLTIRGIYVRVNTTEAAIRTPFLHFSVICRGCGRLEAVFGHRKQAL